LAVSPASDQVEDHVSLPPFLTRVQNAAGPLLGGLSESALGERLRDTSLVLEMDADAAEDTAHRAGYLLATNLAARLYPRLGFDASDELTTAARKLALAINPGCTFGPPRGRTLVLSWRGGEASADRVTVAAENWSAIIDGTRSAQSGASPLAAMAAAALGTGELFRALFADRLPHGRTEPAPFSINLLTLDQASKTAPVPERIELGTVHLAGCGAVGQSFMAALRELPVAGTLVAVDHDLVDEGNLQRYLLSVTDDVGSAKPTVIERALANSDLVVEPVESVWGADQRSAPGRATVISALDSKQGRIELQGGLPKEIFNAWTQTEDIGVSRHQAFGEEPCLACLAWPKRARRNESEKIAEALGESELRVSHYLGNKTPVGQPLPAAIVKGTRRLPLPEGTNTWSERSLLADLIDRYQLPPGPFEALAVLQVEQLYRDAVCAGMLIEHRSEREDDVSVPLAHQSALAGILLATALVVDRVPELRSLRPDTTIARYDVLRGGEQHWPRPRGREERCICRDADYVAAFAARWGGATP
jgi:ThiF family